LLTGRRTLLYCCIVISIWMLLYVPNEIYIDNSAVGEEDISGASYVLPPLSVRLPSFLLPSSLLYRTHMDYPSVTAMNTTLLHLIRQYLLVMTLVHLAHLLY
jgi:hypothetical protein